MTIGKELNDAALANFKVLFRHFHGGTEKSHAISQHSLRLGPHPNEPLPQRK
jgi:hypothetical protein